MWKEVMWWNINWTLNNYKIKLKFSRWLYRKLRNVRQFLLKNESFLLNRQHIILRANLRTNISKALLFYCLKIIVCVQSHAKFREHIPIMTKAIQLDSTLLSSEILLFERQCFGIRIFIELLWKYVFLTKHF